MAEIFKLIPAGFSFKEADGYRLVLPATIGKYFEHARGIGTDLYVVKHYTTKGSTELTRGYVPTGNIQNATELRQRQKELTSRLDSDRNTAMLGIQAVTDVYQNRKSEYSTVFVKCKDGVIGCGWYDHANTKKKGLKLAAFLLYALGIINAENDPTLWEATYRYLPYDSEMGRTDVADEIILSTLKAEVIERNNARPRVERLNTTGNGTNT
jgi:hypothetical protein